MPTLENTTLYDVIDPYTSENATYNEDATLTSGDVVGSYIIEWDSKYYRRVTDGKLRPEWFGCVGDGTTDDTVNFQKCVTAASDKYVVKLLGRYKITDTITIGPSSTWEGARDEKGGSGSVTRINFRPVDTTKYLIFYVNTNPGNYTGPFNFSEIVFDVQDAGLFRFGDETLGEVIDGSIQAYYAGIKIFGCRIIANDVRAQWAGNTDGSFTRTHRPIIWLTKCFESVFENIAITGGDTGIRIFGCDNLRFTNVRFMFPWVAISNIISGTFSVPSTFDQIQVEGWGTAAMILTSGSLVSNSRFESLNSTARNRRFNLSTLSSPITVSVTAGSDTLTFSRSVENIIYPYESIIEVEFSGYSVYVYPITVVGNLVTFRTTDTRFNETASGLTVYRLHGSGVTTFRQIWHKTITSSTFSAAEGCKPIVMASVDGSVNVVGCHHNYTGDVATKGSLVIPNLGGQGTISFVGCNQQILPNVNHPNVFVDNVYSGWGTVYATNNRQSSANTFLEINRIDRRFIYTPKTYTDGIDYNNLNIRYRYYAPRGISSEEAQYCWELVPGGQGIQLYDRLLLFNGYVKVTVRVASSESEGVFFRYTFIQYGTGGAGPTISSVSFGKEFANVVMYLPGGRQFMSKPNEIHGLRLLADTEIIFVVGAIIEEPIGPDGKKLVVLNSAPAVGAWDIGDKVEYTAPTASGFLGLICTTAGTAGTLSGVTGSITTGTSVLAISATENVRKDDYITIAGVTGVKKVLRVSGSTVYLNSNADATVSGAAVAFSAPVWKTFGAISA